MRSSKTTLSLWVILFVTSLVALPESAEAQALVPAPPSQSAAVPATNSAPAAISPPASFIQATISETNQLSQATPPVDSIDPLQQAAEAGDVKSQTRLGQRYWAAFDFKNAFEWYRKAADEGDAEAQFNLGLCYEGGFGVEKNLGEALNWYLEAAYSGDPEMQYELGMKYYYGSGMFKQNFGEAFKWLRKSADQDFEKAEWQLAESYEMGEGVAKNRAEAFNWWRKAADHGDSVAEEKVGHYYLFDQGASPNTYEAYKWYEKSAMQGNWDAQGQLGLMYLGGEGVLKDEIQGMAWLYLAAANGDTYASGTMIPQYEQQYGNDVAAAARQKAKELQTIIPSRSALGNGISAILPPAVAPNTPKASGSGAFISADGLVLTAAHVVQGATRIEVVTAAGKLDATVVKIDATNDVAVLKCTGTNFIPLPITPSKEAREGATVFTIGFPNIQLQGFDPKLTKGEISSQSGFQDDPRQWQISVPIQPGNSGGPLCDENGDLIGIVESTLNPITMAKVEGEIPQNVNYAMKSSYILPLLDDMQNLPAPVVGTSSAKFEDVVGNVQKSVVLILVY